MKKKLVGLIAVCFVALTLGYNSYMSQDKMKLSDLALANVEALASGIETGDMAQCWWYGCNMSFNYDCTVYMGYLPILKCYNSRG